MAENTAATGCGPGRWLIWWGQLQELCWRQGFGAAVLKGEPLPGCYHQLKTRSDLRLLGARTKGNRRGKQKKKKKKKGR